MSAQYWMGDGTYDNTHENEFVAEVGRYLDKLYRDKEEVVHVIFNMSLHLLNEKTGRVTNEGHDIVILTAKKMFDIEMKCHTGRISVDENKNWYSDEIIIDGGGYSGRTPFGQVKDHRSHMEYFLEKIEEVDHFYKRAHPNFKRWKYILGVLMFPDQADLSQAHSSWTESGGRFKLVNLSGLGTLLSRQASGRDTQLSSDEMLILLEKYFKVKQAKLDENGMPYIVKESNANTSKDIRKVPVQKDGGDGDGEINQSVTGEQDVRVRKGETSKDEMPKGINPSEQGTKTQPANEESQSDTGNHLKANDKNAQREQADTKEKPKSANAQGSDGAPSTERDSPATESRKNYVDYPVTQVQVSPARVQVLGAFLRCFCSGWSPISLVSKLFQQKTGVDVKAFVGYDLDTLSRDPVGQKLLEWRRADKYPHKLEVSTIGGKMSEPSPRTVLRVRNFLNDENPGEVDYVAVGKELGLRPEMVMVAHVLRKEA